MIEPSNEENIVPFQVIESTSLNVSHLLFPSACIFKSRHLRTCDPLSLHVNFLVKSISTHSLSASYGHFRQSPIRNLPASPKDIL